MNLGWAIRIGLLMPVALLVALALPRFNTGFLLEKSFPATDFIQTDVSLPATTYRGVARLLAGASLMIPKQRSFKRRQRLTPAFPPLRSFPR